MRCPLCEANPGRGLCSNHRREFSASGEGRRHMEIQAESHRRGCGLSREDDQRLRIALVDYVRRVQAERRNGGAA